MLQRAASNAYSWWWASHIRTTQSKWLDANLQEMENRVKIMLKLLGEEADTFGKRAEMYYRTRPEVISHVEQVYRAYRALVERYDHMSKELHKANHTIATACPEEVQYALLEEEDDNFPKAITPINSNKIHKSTVEEILKRKREGLSGRNKGWHQGSAPHLNEETAQEEISRLQKAILVLQTEKEYVKSSYENGIARYWEIEKQIADTQEEICHIQDAFDTHAAIEDDEARALMMLTALRSCHGTVAKLVDKFEELIRIAVMEAATTKSLRARLHAMSGNTDISSGEAIITDMSVNKRVYPITQEILELQPIYEKIDNFFANSSESSVEEMAEKVDELVDKVMSLELKFPKQSAKIKQLRQENENLKNKLDELQDEMALRDDPSDLNEQIKLLEDAFNRIRALEISIIEEEVFVSTAFSEVFSCVTGISKVLVSSDPAELYNMSTASVNGEMISLNVGLESNTKEGNLLKNEEYRVIEAPRTSRSLSRGREDVSEVVDNSSSCGTECIREEKISRYNCLNDSKEEDSLEDASLLKVDCSCFSGADNSLDFHHTDEVKSVQELPENGGQLNATQNIESLNKYCKVESPEDGCIPLHVDNIQDLRNTIPVDKYSTEARDEPSICMTARGSEETGRLHQQATLVPTDSENLTSDIFHSQLEKKSSNGEEPASEAITSSNHGGKGQGELTTLTGEGASSWQEFLLDGLEGREEILLADYTSVLRNYKETKRRLAELEKKNQEHLEETKAVIQELRNANSMKYVEIRSLRNLVDASETQLSKADCNPTGFLSTRSFRETVISDSTLDREISTVEGTNVSHIEETKIMSPFEVKFRNKIDALVDQNLQFVVRYSMASHHMQDFDRKYQEVLNEMVNMEDKKTRESDTTTESEPAEKKLRELRTELDVWFEQNALLHQEVQLKTTSLCSLQEEIAEALRCSSEIDGTRFTPYEAAKFQGEVLNMQQSNIKIESELQAAQERMRELQSKVNDDLRKLHESFELSSRRLSQTETESSYRNQFKHFPSKSRVPLRNFLFGTKRKKKSMFACINPTLQKQFSDL
ncbi:hypothetical protein EJB05_10373 [Eragrostis curvula]|uniref:NAB domain-containing protein n=1 Tax=Eragrostis curvula TaxID=38414 RepID=A0A5J9VKY8_9POAL|nr:hypothetical protein EJB05_10373 [Eragrostis curvula]